MKPNISFKLNVDDIETIEIALRNQIAITEDEQETRKIFDLLGNIHNQKNWYRPKNKIYVSG